MWPWRSAATRARRSTVRFAARAPSSRSRAASGCSTRARWASPATATPARHGWCSTPTSGSPAGDGSRTTSARPRRRSARPISPSRWPSGCNTASDPREASSMRRPMGRTLRILVPCALGLFAAFLVSCGDTSKLIPGDDAAAINQNIDAASGASSDGRCSRAAAAVDRAEAHVQQLPGSVDSKLRADLEQGIARLRAAAASECTENKPETTATTESTATTQTTETATTASTESTQSTETQPTETQPTQTQQTDTSGGNNGNGNGQGGGGTGGTGGGGSRGGGPPRAGPRPPAPPPPPPRAPPGRPRPRRA